MRIPQMRPLPSLLLLAALSAARCTATPLHATSVQTVTVTIHVLIRAPNSQTPIANAIVTDGRTQVQTDPNGYATLTEPCDAPLAIRAEAEGFRGFTADTDRLTGPETWTFYLEVDH